MEISAIYDGTVAVIAPQPRPVRTRPASAKVKLAHGGKNGACGERTHIRELMSSSGHDDGTNDEDEDIDLEGPLAADFLSKRETEECTEEGPCLEGRGDVAGDAFCLCGCDIEISLETLSGDCGPNKGRVVTKTRAWSVLNAARSAIADGLTAGHQNQ